MRLYCIASLVLGTLCLGTALRAVPRTWHDTSGRGLKAEFLYANSQKVYLKLEGGKTTEVALGRLSNEDLEFIQEWKKAREKEGIVFEAPLGFEIFRSKKFSAAQAQNAGYFPLQSGDSDGILRLEFRRYGEVPKGAAQPVLHLFTANSPQAGTSSQIKVYFQGKVVGSAGGAAPRSRVVIPLAPSVLVGNPLIEFTIKCGRDNVLIKSKNSGKGARLLILRKDDQ